MLIAPLFKKKDMQKIIEFIQDNWCKRILIKKNTPEAVMVADAAAKLDIKIGKTGCNDCLNDAYLSIINRLKRDNLIFIQQKNTTMLEFSKVIIERKKEFFERKYSINNPLHNQPISDGSGKHGKEFDVNSSDIVLFDISRYNSTGYLSYFEVKEIVQEIEIVEKQKRKKKEDAI